MRTVAYRWLTEPEHREIRRLNAKGLNDGDIAVVMARAITTIARHRTALGLPARIRSTPQTLQRQATAMSRAHRRDLGDAFGNYQHAAHRLRAAALGWPGRRLFDACFLTVLLDGPASTTELRINATELRRRHGWKPTDVIRDRAYKTLSDLRRAGLVRVVGVVDRARPGRGGKEKVYELTPEAINRIRQVA